LRRAILGLLPLHRSREAAAVEDFRQARRVLYEELANADGLAVIDSDAGGWPDTPSMAFVDFFSCMPRRRRRRTRRGDVLLDVGGWPENGHLETYVDILSLFQERCDGRGRSWPVRTCTARP